MDGRDRLLALIDGNEVIGASDGRYETDIVPGRTLEQAIEEYRLHEEE